MIRTVFLSGLAAFGDLVGQSAVQARWGEPSALPGYMVGGLAGHALSASLAVERYLDQDPPNGVQPTAGVAYLADLPGPAQAEGLHEGIRDRGRQCAEEGADSVRDGFREVHKRLTVRLAEEPGDRLLKPFGDRAYRLDDYLETRVVELAVHYDDLVASCNAESVMPEDCVVLASDHLVRVARYRHGSLAVLRALARRERDVGALNVL